MADIPQEVREAAAKIAAAAELRPFLLSGRYDDHPYIEAFHAMFLAGKRAGMDRAAEIAEGWDGSDGYGDVIAQAIRSEATSLEPARAK